MFCVSLTETPAPTARQGARRTWLDSIDHAYTDTVLRARLLGEKLTTQRWEWILILAVAAVAALLRFHRLDHPHKLIFDETYYVKDAYSLLHFGVEMEWEEDINDAFIAGEAEPLNEPAYVVHPPLGKWLIGLGMLLFGSDNGFGWRFSSAMVGTLSVLILSLIAWKIFHSSFLGATAGLLMAVDGHHLVMSRTGLLDIFLSFFVLAGFGALVLDRDHGRRQLADTINSAYRSGTLSQVLRYGPMIWWRPWRIVAGILLAAGCSVKLSGLAFVAIFGLMTVFWDLNARRVVGIRRWALGGILRDGLWAFVCVVGVGFLTYLATWTGWFVSSRGYHRHWAEDNPAESWLGSLIPDTLRSWFHYHRASTEFHTGLDSGHNYASSPWTWPFMGRPVSFHYESTDDGSGDCGAAHCSEAILDLANPILWWSGTVAIIILTVVWFAKRDWRVGAILGAYVAGQLVWVLWPERTMFFFYTIAYEPFLILAIVYCLGWLLRWETGHNPRAKTRNLVIVLGYILVIMLVSAFFMPIWTAEEIPYDQWRWRMWIQSWI